jgi:hypothetical protein
MRFNSASWPLSIRSATAFGRPFASATGLASSLSGCVSLTGQRCLFRHRRRCGRFSRTLPRPRVLPGPNAPFVPPFGVFRLADLPFGRPPESFVPCWCAVTTICPLGNCDSLTGRNCPWVTSLDSQRLLSIAARRSGSFFALPGSARTLPAEPVNAASSVRGLRRKEFRGTEPTSLVRSFPGRPGLSVSC